MDKDHLMELSDYELCALYCDYHEWLISPTTGPDKEETIQKYEQKCKDILNEIAGRYADA